jgi:hypothetical protein
MTEQLVEPYNFDLAHFLERFPVDQTFNVPLLTDPYDISMLHTELVPVSELYRLLTDQIELEVFQDYYLPLRWELRSPVRPYCSAAEGKMNGRGWRALVYRRKLSKIASIENFPIKKAVFNDDQLVGAETVKENKEILFKTHWNDGRPSEPSGIYVNEENQAKIVSPVVVAMYYDNGGEAHFFHDIFRAHRPKSYAKTQGFVWEIRPARIDVVTKIVIKRFLKNWKG